ncbi:P-loop NTPase fold protein [Bacillus toyonensis]|uniref:P-loop NTPase fold protein n=1 Tax=Bacillus toyonensis TaxID=155322 RepID=UPI00346569D5
MKAYLKHQSISDSPYEKDVENEVFILPDKELFEQIVLEIVNGNPASFLISGYRGAGKTSFINKIKEKCVQKDSSVLFISLNFGKYEEFSLILRKIIREVYLAIDNKQIVENTDAKSSINNVKKLLKQDNPNLLKELELIYERTFYQVTENRKHSMQTERGISQAITYDIKKAAISVGLLIVAGIGNGFQIVEKIFGINNTSLGRAILILSALWAGFESYKLTLSYSKKKTELDELSRSSLYDNEIAEFQLRKILKGLKQTGLKMVFIIDEVDKIDNDEKLNSLISELKPLMLSGLASFVLISGQKLYYKYQASHIIDDAIISSIFSKTIHVPLLSIDKFEELFKKLLQKESDFSNTLLQDYVNSKILQSNRLPRRFISLIRQNLKWEEQAGYITIDKDIANALKTDTKLLEIIKDIEDKYIKQERFDGGIKDFFITQLHIWTQKIKLNRYVPFTLHDIYDLEQYSKEVHSSWYLAFLSKLAIQLLDNLTAIGLLQKENKETEEEIKVSYKWIDDAEVIVDDGIKPDDGKWAFMENFIRLEKTIRNIWNQLGKKSAATDNGRKNNSIVSIIKGLITQNVINQSITSPFYELNKLRNRIAHGEDINVQEENMILDSEKVFTDLETMIIEQSSHYYIRQFMAQNGIYNVQDVSNNFYSPFEFESTRDEDKLRLCFQVKNVHKDLPSSNYIYNVLSDFKEYKLRNKDCYLVILVYSQQNDMQYEKFISEIALTMEKEYAELAGDVFVFHYPDFEAHMLRHDMQYVLTNIREKLKDESLQGI